ncbi:MAG TPA: hypothetical protein VEH30_07755 [Terriglobales bacterium]|nr:hypothetical protein [Terriglobales bacterium]
MFAVMVVVALMLMLGLPMSKAPLRAQESTQSQPSPTSSAQNTAASTPAGSSKPCPASADASSTQVANCPPAREKHKKHHVSSITTSGTGTTTVVHNGSTSDPVVAISPTLTEQQASQQLSKTNQLLANADANLRQVTGRSLSTDEEDTLKQIQVYMEQAKTAIKNGEAQRAYNLANKAKLLSADLARQHR